MIESEKYTDLYTRVLTEIIEMASMITGMEQDEINPSEELFAFGFDSMLLMALGKQINNKYKVDISLDLLVTSFNTLEKLAGYIAEQYQSGDLPQDEEAVVEQNDILPDEVAIAVDNSTSYLNDTSALNIQEDTKLPLSDNLNTIQKLFNGQFAIMQEQNAILKSLVMGTGATSTSDSVLKQRPTAVSENNKKDIIPKIIDKKPTQNYYVPYKKLSLQESSALGNLQSKYFKSIQEKYTSFTKTSKDATHEYRKVHAEWRNITGFRPLFKEMIYPIYAKKGSGSKIIDVDGNELIDMTMGFGVNMFGNSPSFVKKALAEAINSDGMPLGPLEILPGEVARKISELTGVERVFFCNSGTEADMVSVRLARAVTGKNKVVCFTGSYHGNYDGFLGIPIFSNKEVLTMPMAPGISENAVKDLILLEYDKESSLKYIEEHSDVIAAVLTEPVQSRRPDIQPKEFLHKLRKVTEENDIALIFDEVVTGFRIAKGGAQEYFGVQADIVNYGKVIGGGMPIGVVAGKSKYLDSIDGGMWNYGDDSLPIYSEKRTFVGGTFCHHHLAMVASNAVLDYINDNKDTMYKELNDKTKRLSERLNKFFKEENITLEMYNFGSLFRFNITPDKEIFYYGLLEKGLYIWEGRNFFLSTEHNEEDIEKIYSAVKDTVLEMKKAGYFGDPTGTDDDPRHTFTTKAKQDKSVGFVEKVNIEGNEIPMSLIQQRLYSRILIEESDPFDLAGVSIVDGNIDINMLEVAVNQIIERHEILRTSLHLEEGEFKQRVHTDVRIKVREVYQSDTANLNTFISASLKKFVLEAAPLLEVLILHTYDNQQVLVFHCHHTVSDGISMGIFTGEVATICNKTNLSLPDKQYRDFVKWENDYMTSVALKRDHDYLVDKLSNVVYAIPLPYDSTNRSTAGYDGRVIYDLIDKTTVTALKDVAKSNSISLFMVLLSALNILLHKVSRENSIAITTPVSSRFIGGFENSMGMYTNTIALSSEYSGEQYLTEYLQCIKKTCLASYGHINYPYNLLINELHATGENAFNVMFGYENAETRLPEINGVKLKPIEYKPSTQEFDISFDLQEKSGAIEINFSYRTDLFNAENMELILERYKLVIDQIIKNQKAKLSDIEISTAAERERILGEFNQTTVDYSNDKTIVDLFEEQVAKTPDKVAVMFKDDQLTYADLNAKANQVARRLIKAGVGLEDAVCLMTERSLETIICIHGILKAGAAYMPIDPRYPEERIRYMLEDCQPKVILAGNFAVPDGLEIEIIDIFDENLYTGDTSNVCVEIRPDNLVHLLYTSGTTGKPKGVMSTHTGLVNRIEWMQKQYPMNEDDVILQKTTYTFDVSVYELLWSNLVGAKMGLLKPGGEVEVDEIAEAIYKYKVTHILFVPTVLKELLKYVASDSRKANILEKLKIVVTSGEALTEDLVGLFNETMGDSICVLANLYGPTEVSIDSTYYNCSKEEKGIIPIGKPISNITTYILNGNELCGIGVIGELCLGGVGVARGYLNRPELTDEKFIDNPYGEGKLYRSGDLTRWLPDGNIEYLGRIDEQVKIRGQRIELGEIESAIRKLENITDVVVIAKADMLGEKAIYAYIVGKDEVNIKGVRDELRGVLPEYMVPPYMMQIEKIPLKTNGKINKRALPEIEAKSERIYVEPRNEIENALCNVFSEVLGVGLVGVEDSFFELGGDSIKAIKVISKMRDAGYEISSKDIMVNYSVEAIASVVVPLKENNYNQNDVVGTVISTPIIKDFIARGMAKPNHYNQAVMIATDTDDEEVIKKALHAVVKHHDVLRSVYKDDSLTILSSDESKMFDFESFNLIEDNNMAETIESESTRIQGSIDLEHGPLVKAALYRTANGNYIMLCIHHLVVDGVSWRILGDDLTSALIQLESGSEIVLPPKTASYIEWGEALEEYKDSSILQMETEYWQQVSKNTFDRNIRIENDMKVKDGASGFADIDIMFTKEETELLLHDAGKAFNTEINDLMLSALGMAVGQLTGQEKVAVELEGHGREEIHKKIDIDRTVGWFTSVYPIIIDCCDDMEVSIISTKEMLRKVPNHGIGYGLLSSVSRQNNIDICFNYLGQMDINNFNNNSTYSVGKTTADENRIESNINMDGYIMNDTLSFSLTYDKTSYSQKHIKKLAQLYKNCLSEIIKFCVNRDDTVKTVSDYGVTDMEAAELDEIKEILA